MNASATSFVSSGTVHGEAAELIVMLDRHREFLLHTAQGLTEQQARTASTVSALTIGALLKHVADTEEQWFRFAVEGASAFGEEHEVYGEHVDWDAIDAEAATNDGDWSGSEWEDDRFTLAEHETLEFLRTRFEQVAARTEEVLRTADLNTAHALPVAPWFAPGESWSVRRVAMHMLAEIAQHSGHADIIREAIDGQRTMG